MAAFCMKGARQIKFIFILLLLEGKFLCFVQVIGSGPNHRQTEKMLTAIFTTFMY